MGLTGKTVRVTFLDHAEGTDTPIKFIVHGRCAQESPDKLVIHTWHYADEDYEPDDNIHMFVIVRSCVEQIDVLD